MKIAGIICRSVWLLILCLPLAVHAEDESPEALAQQATQLLLEGREDAASQILSTLVLRVDPPLQALFLSGQIAGNHGEWKMAIRYYRIMLERVPAMLRVRLELARALYMNGEFEAAEHHFNLVLGEPSLPSEVRSNVMAYISQIEHQTFSQSISVELLNDSNINQATANQVVMIGNQPFVLSRSALQQAGVGMGATWQGQYLFGKTHQYSLRGVAQHQNYSGTAFDFTYLQSYAGATKRWGPAHALAIEGGGHVAVYGGRKLYDGLAFRLADTWRSENGLMLSTALESKQLRYPDFAYRDSWQHWLSVDVSKALAAGVLLNGGVSYGRNLARENAYSFTANGAKVGGLIELPWRMVGSVSLDYQHSRYDAEDPFFGLARQENKVGMELGLMPLALAWEGFAPRLVLGHANNRSNIALYDYRKSYTKVVFTREF